MQPLIRNALALAVLTSTAVGAQTLRGSPASVDLMYNTAHARDLQFFNTPADIYAAAMSGELKLVSMTEDLEVDKAGWPFVLPNTLRFADSLAGQYHAACGERLVVTSGARPLDKQPRNASPKSVHPTGMAVDFRRPRTPACLEWLRKSLVDLEDAGVVEATEEKHPPHFHVAVLRQKPETHVQMAAGDVALAPASATPAAKPVVKQAVKSSSAADSNPTKAGTKSARAGKSLAKTSAASMDTAAPAEKRKTGKITSVKSSKAQRKKAGKEG